MKILSSSISSFHPNKFHWKDISSPCLPIYLIGFCCFELYRLITYMSSMKTMFLFLYNPNSISPDIFLLNKKKQKSQTALLLHLSELPVSFYISLKFFILLESSPQTSEAFLPFLQHFHLIDPSFLQILPEFSDLHP